jgi:thiamine-phosphate diphosphorylase / hydroxyethylthiazole kinase
MGKPEVDYSLYLVTDSTAAILGSKDLVQVIEAAVKGGVTIVQYRVSHACWLLETSSTICLS